MRAFICLTIAAILLLLLLASAFMPDLWSVLLVTMMCPNSNWLSPTCGAITTDFIIWRIVQVTFWLAVVVLVVGVARLLLRK